MTREKELYAVTLAGGAVNVVLLVFKFVAGILGHSAAMIADAVHSFSDFATDIIVLVFVKLGSAPQDKEHPYGHGKYETIATTMIGIILMVVAVGIFYNGFEKVVAWWQGESLEAPGKLALWAAFLSILLKEITYRFTVRVGKKNDSPAVIANAWHHRSDALSSIGTALGIGGAILLGEKWRILDPIASMVVGVFIVKVAWKLTKDGFMELMERSLPDDIISEITSIASSVPGVLEPHSLRTRRIGSSYAIEMHIYMVGNTTLTESHEKATEVEEAIKAKYGPKTYVTVHVEPVEEKD